jgi:hypothetical protein
MIPNSDNYDSETWDDLITDFDVENEPSLTHAMNFNLEPHSFVGKVDRLEAVKQAVLKMLNIERYEHEIYSWDYGVELSDLYGTPLPYAMSEVKHRIIDALTSDDRIESVDDFTVERIGKRTLHCTFTVTISTGEFFETESEVDI